MSRATRIAALALLAVMSLAALTACPDDKPTVCVRKATGHVVADRQCSLGSPDFEWRTPS